LIGHYFNYIKPLNAIEKAAAKESTDNREKNDAAHLAIQYSHLMRPSTLSTKMLSELFETSNKTSKNAFRRKIRN